MRKCFRGVLATCVLVLTFVQCGPNNVDVKGARELFESIAQEVNGNCPMFTDSELWYIVSAKLDGDNDVFVVTYQTVLSYDDFEADELAEMRSEQEIAALKDDVFSTFDRSVFLLMREGELGYVNDYVSADNRVLFSVNVSLDELLTRYPYSMYPPLTKKKPGLGQSLMVSVGKHFCIYLFLCLIVAVAKLISHKESGDGKTDAAESRASNVVCELKPEPEQNPDNGKLVDEKKEGKKEFSDAWGWVLLVVIVVFVVALLVMLNV